MRRVLKVLCVVAVVALSSGCRTKPIQRPDFAIQAKSQSQVGEVVKNCLKRRGWIIEQSGAGYYVARYDYRPGTNSATIRVDYTTSKIKIDLVRSVGLLQEKTAEGEVIHRRYNGWMQYLQRCIELELSHQM